MKGKMLEICAKVYFIINIIEESKEMLYQAHGCKERIKRRVGNQKTSENFKCTNKKTKQKQNVQIIVLVNIKMCEIEK